MRDVDPGDGACAGRCRAGRHGRVGRAAGGCRRPAGLRVPGFEASLADLLLVFQARDGGRDGRDREWFANNWPAAASAILKAGRAKQAFRRVDGNRAAAVGAAAFCCQERATARRLWRSRGSSPSTEGPVPRARAGGRRSAGRHPDSRAATAGQREGRRAGAQAHGAPVGPCPRADRIGAGGGDPGCLQQRRLWLGGR